MPEQDYRVYAGEFEYGTLYNGSPEIPSEFWKMLPHNLGHAFPMKLRTNGSRIYPDCGHIEYASPEAGTIDDFVHSELAGERIVTETLTRVAEGSPRSSFRIQKRAIDSNGNHYGSHLSFNVLRSVRFDEISTAERERNVQALAALYSARIALVGGGYFDTVDEEWRLSQRGECFDKLTSMSCHGIGNRPLVDIRNESFANDFKYRRLHDSSGDPNISIWALRTKVGLVSGYLRLLENGADLERFYLAAPLLAARVVAKDLTLKQTVGLRDGKRATALNLLEGMSEAILQYHDDGRYVPDDELAVVQDVHEIATKAADDMDVLSYKSDWYTRMRTAEKAADKKSLTDKKRMEHYAAVDQQYDMIAIKKANSDEVTPGYNMKFRKEGRFGDYSEDTVEDLMSHPPSSSRAFIRGKLLQAALSEEVIRKYGYIQGASWDVIKFSALAKPFDLSEPAKHTTNRVMKRIFRAADISIDVDPNS